MKANYKKEEEIQAEIRNTAIEEYCEFDNTGRLDFFRCESCDGPILGHIAVKCRAFSANGQIYDKDMTQIFMTY